MVRIQLKVDLSDGLPFVVVVLRSVRHLPARIVGFRQTLGEVERSGTEERRTDLVVDEWRAQRHLSTAVARRSGICGEITRQHRGRRNVRNVRGRRLTRSGSLVGPEEEQLVT